MQAFFNTKDTGSGLGAGTILGGCLGLPPAKDTGLGCTKVKRGCRGPTAGCWVAGDSARPQGDAEGVGWRVVMIRPWLWLKVVAEASCVRVVEAVWVMTAGDLLAPENFCGCRKVGGIGGFRGVAGGTSGTAGGAGTGVGLGESTGMVNTGRKGCGTLSGGAEGPKSAGWIKGSSGWEVRSQPGLSVESRAVAAGDAMRLSGRLTVGREVVGRMLS